MEWLLDFWNAYSATLAFGLVNSLFALSMYSVLSAGILSFTTVVFAAIGGFTAAQMMGTFGLPLWLAVMIAGAISISFWIWARNHKKTTGRSVPGVLGGLGVFVVISTLAFLATGGPVGAELPAYSGLNFAGGLTLKPEFVSLLVGLVLYTAAYIGENVRSGITSVHAGQIEAANALGVSRGIVTRLIMLPQALRVTIPATTNDYASLVKNSSLAVAIGFPDMVSIGGTIIGQNGQAIEIIGMWMAVYLTINLLISLAMNFLNSRVQIVER